MRAIKSALLVVSLAQAPGAWALCSTNWQFGAGDAVVDALVLRPFGMFVTVLGGAAFLVTTPFLGIASIPPPHDALAKASELLVLEPAAWTFDRPLGDCRAMGYDNW